jgi:hypothetical protein
MNKVRHYFAVFTLCASLGAAVPALADPVTHWNDITWRAVTIGRPGPVGFLDAALAHLAIHDAVQAFEGRYEPYKVAIPGATGSPVAAVAAAAHGVLVGLYPGQAAALDADLNAFLTANGLHGNPGLVVGLQAAEALLTEYRPAITLPAFTGSTEPGQWRPTPAYLPPPPAPFAPMAFLYLAYTKPFTMLRPSQFRPQPPPPMTSERYRRDYDEVKALGSDVSTARTDAQTDLAHFWSENFLTQWNRALRAIVDDHPLPLGDSARLFALANMAAADGTITGWESKRHFNFWRPVTAIQEADTDGNPRTEADPAWHPLVNTPPYQDYTSGANILTGVMTSMLQQFFGTDDFEFVVTSNAPLATTRTRTYLRFSDAAQEVVDARVLLGIHFRFADEEARRQGSRVAHWAFMKFLRPRH